MFSDEPPGGGGGNVCSLVFISRCMWPKGPCALRQIVAIYIPVFPIPARRHPQQPTGYHAVLVGLPLPLLPIVSRGDGSETEGEEGGQEPP